MKTKLQVLGEDERTRIHEQTLGLLAKTGLRVDSARGRQILRQAGAEVDELTGMVRFPRTLVEEALRAAPRKFSLAGRRPGWNLAMNAGECSLVMDGQAVYVYDLARAERRPSTFDDWLAATRLCDSLQEVGVYWEIVPSIPGRSGICDFAKYWFHLLHNFSKHIQESTEDPQQTRCMLEMLQVVYGGQEEVRRCKPLSFLLCPLSPLVIEGPYTEAYLETIGWDIPVAVMPMPIAGMSSPASLISTLLLANCEMLAMLCLVQGAAPHTPFLYAACPTLMAPRTGRYSGGSVENALLGAATTEMARFYGLPAQASTGGSDHHVPSVQVAYERTLNWLLPVLSWPDLLVGPGLLSGAMTLSLEQLLLDTEVFRRSERLLRGIDSREARWLEGAIDAVGPGGNFLAQRSTRQALREGEWYLGKLGVHEPFERWEAEGKKGILEEASAKVADMLAGYQPMQLEEHAERELERIVQRAREAAS